MVRNKERGNKQRKETETEEEKIKGDAQKCTRQVQHDSQFCGVLRNVVWYFGEFLVGAVDRGALTATLLGAGQVGEAVPSQLAAVILSTWSKSQPQRH